MRDLKRKIIGCVKKAKEKQLKKKTQREKGEKLNRTEGKKSHQRFFLHTGTIWFSE